MNGIALAVDGGNSKTDLALVGADGALLAFARGPMASPHHIGLNGCLQVLEDLLGQAMALAGLAGPQPVAQVGHVMLAGADLPVEERALRAAIKARGWTERTTVGNDTFAILRAGTDRGWGVAITCGAGINCVGVSPDGRHVRFPSLGTITGDWGGGQDVGLAALYAAARSEDGRGPRTRLQTLVPEHFGRDTPLQVAEDIHLGRIGAKRVHELAPVVFAAAADDPVAVEIVDRLAGEIVAFARAAITRLGLEDGPVEVLLGGGLMRAADGRLRAAIADGLAAIGPGITPQVVEEAPVVGAALLGLDDLGADDEARTRVRRELDAAVRECAALATR